MSNWFGAFLQIRDKPGKMYKVGLWAGEWSEIIGTFISQNSAGATFEGIDGENFYVCESEFVSAKELTPLEQLALAGD